MISPQLEPPSPRPSRPDRISEVIEHVTIGWSPTTEPTKGKPVQGEPPMPLEEPALLARETVTLIPWSFREEHYDVVDEAVAESFPASDPPSWTLGRKTH